MWLVLRLLGKNERKNGIKATNKVAQRKLRHQKQLLRLLKIAPEQDRRSKTDLFRGFLTLSKKIRFCSQLGTKAEFMVNK